MLLEFGLRSQWVAEPLRPQCTHDRLLAYPGRATGRFCDISRSEPTRSGQPAMQIDGPEAAIPFP